jgi:rare lipoprotein A
MRTQEAEVIAKIHSYEFQGRQVATLYVRSIPVLTFLGSPSASADGMKMGQAELRPHSSPQPYSQKTPSSGASENTALMAQPRRVPDATNVQNDAVWRATAVAAKLNQLSLNNVPANAIAVRWQPECNCYSINVNNQELVQINNRTFLPDTTQNLATDALQATNRLRRLMGNAPPLQEIIGMPVASPRPVARVAVGPVRVQVTGMASWYGPGFHGNQSASGEIYNQNAMTAAHRSLPFGTKVQVTNLDNGRSTVVRINDRGPYVGNRVIDLSAAAARVLGVMQTGIAPVRLDILDNAGAVATQR